MTNTDPVPVSPEVEAAEILLDSLLAEARQDAMPLCSECTCTCHPGDRDRMTRRDNDRFAEHASPEAIEVHLKRAQSEASRWQRRVVWLSELLKRRKAEKEAGIWPPRKEGI